MYGQIYENLVLYQNRPQAGNRYRQIVVVELHQFQVRILEGDVLQPDPQFAATSDDAEVYLHPTLDSAVADAEKEHKASVQAGWIPYTG